jgi:NADH dehydrogenase
MYAEMRKNIFLKEYPELATAASNIYLIDGGDALLAPMSKSHNKTLIKRFLT